MDEEAILNICAFATMTCIALFYLYKKKRAVSHNWRTYIALEEK